MNRKNATTVAIILALLAGAVLIGKNLPPAKKPAATPTAIVQVTKVPPPTVAPKATATPISPDSVNTDTPAPSETAFASNTPAEPVASNTAITPLPTETSSATPPPTETLPPPPTATALPPTQPGAAFTPWPAAPLCLDSNEFHDVTKFHTEWNAAVGCHYDHEHGVNPFTPLVASIFPGFDLKALGCGMEVNHCSPSSPIENTWDGKHGGWKWDVTIPSFSGCTGFESAPTGISAAVVGYHTFGNYAVELNGRLHSALILARETKCGNPNDHGYVYVTTIQDYGQRTVPYQGDIMPYPDTPNPAYDPPRGPYISFDCVGTKATGQRGACRESLVFVLSRNANTNSIWTSKKTGAGVAAVQGNQLFQLLFRVRDTYQLVDWSDLVYPFTFKWLCSADSGASYAALPGCRYNNTTSKVQEVRLFVPPVWDGLAGVDQDGAINGRFTGQFLVTKFGDLAPAGVCLQPNMTCFPVKYVNAFVGEAGGQLIDGKFPQFSPEGQPERDICFNPAGAVLNCDQPGAKPAGWIGPAN